MQPLNAENKFPVSLNTPVFTTIYVLNHGSDITYISRELDGDWQFMGAESIDDYKKIGKIVSLEEIISIDDSVLKVSEIPIGYQATRLDKHHPWEILKIEYTDEEIAQMGFYCVTCGLYHKNIPMAYGADAPVGYDQIPEKELERRTALNEDLCIIDDEIFYIKGNLLINVENDEDFSWNVWVEISRRDYEHMIETWNDETRNLIEPYPGKIANELVVYPSTLGLDVNVYTQKVGYRPRIKVVKSTHPLFYEQENGIGKDRVIEFAKKILYSH